MNYWVTVGGRQVKVEIDRTGVKVDGELFDCALEAVPGTPLKWLRLGDSVVTLALTRGFGRWMVEWAGERFSVSVETAELPRRPAGVAGSGSGSELVRAPMPGLVLRVEVSPGQKVAPGTGLVVLEAMKMENEIQAPRRGVVRRVLVEVDQAVEKGAGLVELADLD